MKMRKRMKTLQASGRGKSTKTPMRETRSLQLNIPVVEPIFDLPHCTALSYGQCGNDQGPFDIIYCHRENGKKPVDLNDCKKQAQVIMLQSKSPCAKVDLPTKIELVFMKEKHRGGEEEDEEGK